MSKKTTKCKTMPETLFVYEDYDESLYAAVKSIEEIPEDTGLVGVYALNNVSMLRVQRSMLRVPGSIEKPARK